MLISKLRASSMHMMIAAAILAAGTPPVLGEDLGDVLESFTAARNQTPSAAASEAWAQTLRNAIANANANDPNYSVTLYTLGELELSIGETENARNAFQTIVNDVNVDVDTQLSAARYLPQVSAQAGDSLDATMRYFQQFEDLVVGDQRRGVPVGEGFIAALITIDKARSQMIESYMRETASQWGDAAKNNPMLKSQLADYLLQAGDLLQQYVIDAYGNPQARNYADWLSLDASTLHAAALFSESAQLNSESGYDAQAILTRQRVVSMLEAFTRSDAEEPLKVTGATILLREYFPLAPSLSDYVEYARAVLTTLPPNHEVLSFLRNHALGMTADPGLLATANKLFDLVLSFEEQWFGKEYKDHVNYQWALVESAANELRMGNVWEANVRILRIEDLKLQGDYLKERFKTVTTTRTRYMQNMYGARIPAQQEIVVGEAAIKAEPAPVIAQADPVSPEPVLEINIPAEKETLTVAHPPVEQATERSSISFSVLAGVGALAIAGVASLILRRFHAR
jgi:hypothetical protein